MKVQCSGGVAQARVNFTGRDAFRSRRVAYRVPYLNGLQFSHHLYTVNSPTTSPLVWVFANPTHCPQHAAKSRCELNKTEGNRFGR